MRKLLPSTYMLSMFSNEDIQELLSLPDPVQAKRPAGIWRSKTPIEVDPLDPLKALAPQQKLVVLALLSGKAEKEIAIDFNLKFMTVNSYKQAALKRLGLRGIAALACFGARYGLIEL